MQHDSSKQTLAAPTVHWPLLIVGISIMLIGSVFPFIFSDKFGEADHSLAFFLFFAMAAALIRGVGYIPKIAIFRWLFSGFSCVVYLVIAAFIRFGYLV